MGQLSKSFALGFSLVMICLLPLCAQTGNAPAPNAAANPAPSGQAPDNMTAKITELVHAGKYADAQQLTAGLLIAYPNDQRLIKAKALIEKLLAPAGSVSTPPVDNHPTRSLASAQPTAAQLTAMDKVEYNSLIELARQAQQTTDLQQQKASLKQFMDRSNTILQKYPDETLLWQLRAASALSLDDLMAGYEAGQKLLAAGAADSNDPNLQQLLSRLNLKGWLDKKVAVEITKYGWILGNWKLSLSVDERRNAFGGQGENEDFSISASVIEGHSMNDGVKSAEPDLRGTILDSGEIRWERYLSPSGGGSYILNANKEAKALYYPSGWQPVISWEFGNDKRTMKMVIPSQLREMKNLTDRTVRAMMAVYDHPVTLSFTRIDSTH
jgi:hypothetical protein